MDGPWTLPALVAEVATRIAALPAPKNGQVRAVPDDRTVRYYGTLGLLDRPSAMRGRTALYGRRHVAQVVAIKRLQTLGRSLAEIQTLWPTLDDATLARMSGVELAAAVKPAARIAFWKHEPAAGRVDPASIDDVHADDDGAVIADDDGAGGARGAVDLAMVTGVGGSRIPTGGRSGAPVPGVVVPAGPAAAPPATAASAGVELRVELAPNVILSLAVVDERVAISPADVRAIRAAAAPLLVELASRRLASHPAGEEP